MVAELPGGDRPGRGTGGALRYLGLSTGEFDILAEGVFASHKALHRFLTDCIGGPGGVRDTRTFVILHTVKYGAR